MTKIARMGIAVVCLSSTLVASDSVFDFDTLIGTPLNSRILNSVERDGIVTEQVMFHSETDGEKDVEIFAFFSYPFGARNCRH